MQFRVGLKYLKEEVYPVDMVDLPSMTTGILGVKDGKLKINYIWKDNFIFNLPVNIEMLER